MAIYRPLIVVASHAWNLYVVEPSLKLCIGIRTQRLVYTMHWLQEYTLNHLWDTTVLFTANTNTALHNTVQGSMFMLAVALLAISQFPLISWSIECWLNTFTYILVYCVFIGHITDKLPTVKQFSDKHLAHAHPGKCWSYSTNQHLRKSTTTVRASS